jgi:branched-chain amino acid transport system ATP-binding protein
MFGRHTSVRVRKRKMLSVKNLRVKYGPIVALKGISLEVEAGNIVTVLGANGAGKSSLLLAISGIVEPSEGTILFQDSSINKKDPAQIVRLGISHVPEGRGIFPDLTVLENLKLGMYVRHTVMRGRKRKVKKDLEWVFSAFPQLFYRRNHIASKLSGGEQQMLAIGRALMQNPSLLLLDEPSLGLAPVLVEEIFQILLSLKKQGVTILLVEQNAHIALSIAEYGYVLETGRVMLAEKVDDLKENAVVREYYLGLTETKEVKSYARRKSYRVQKRWR